MQLDTARHLLDSIRDSGLFTPEQLSRFEGEFAPDANAQATAKALVAAGHLTNYQIKKLLSDRAFDLLVGGYIITDKLGSGGMGKVYQAKRRSDGRVVALKVVRTGFIQNPTVRGRYAREVQAASALNHPNIVSMIEAGEADGRVFLAMEFVDGIDLSRLMRDFGVVAVEEACEYARQAALGLQHAHERGFVHRDVKPSNLVVAGERHLPQATEPAVVKLADLGLARAIDPDEMVAPHLTRDHAVVGTPDYMSPEQAKNSRSADPRSDLYSLGCTLYFLLTGRVPFTQEGAIEKILAHQTEPPSPLQALRPEIPAAVAAIVVKLMSKNPEDRFQTARELAEALEPHARYPQGAAAVEVPARDNTRRAGRGTENTVPRTGGSSTGSLPGLPESWEGLITPPTPVPTPTPVPEPRAQPVAPSDHTPRPRGFDLPAERDQKPEPERARPRVPASAAEMTEDTGNAEWTAAELTKSAHSSRLRDEWHRATPWLVPVLFAMLVVVVLALGVWLFTKL